MFMDGSWTPARSDRTFEVTNPATGEVIDSVPDSGVEGRPRGDQARRLRDLSAAGTSTR